MAVGPTRKKELGLLARNNFLYRNLSQNSLLRGRTERDERQDAPPYSSLLRIATYIFACLGLITIPIEMIMPLNIGIRKSLHLFLESKTDERDRARAHAP